MTLTRLVTVLKTPLCMLLPTVVCEFQSERGVHVAPPAAPLPTGLYLVLREVQSFLVLLAIPSLRSDPVLLMVLYLRRLPCLQGVQVRQGSQKDQSDPNKQSKQYQYI